MPIRHFEAPEWEAPEDGPPSYLLGSSEFDGDFARTRACWLQARLQGPDSREYVWVKVWPPVIGQPFGVGDDLEDLILTPRHAGMTLSQLSDDPMPVQIYIVRNIGALLAREFTTEDVEMVAWGETFLPAGDGG